MSDKQRSRESVDIPAIAEGDKPIERIDGKRDVSNGAEIERFLAEIRSMPVAQRTGTRGRLMFAMDATMSRQPTWDMALGLQADMFREVARLGGLDVQLVYFRGMGECKAGKWVSDAEALARLMSRVDCRGGHTQIGKVLAHAIREAERGRVGALVYVGDCMEENADELCDLAGRLALHGTPIFVFQEGFERTAEATFRELARLTRGAFCRFDRNAAGQLRELLAAVAVYATGGRAALEDLGRGHKGARLLLEQLK